MSRVDLYTTIHKGVRNLLFQTTAAASQTDFADPADAARLAAAVRRAVRLLEGHAEHEDREVMPVLARVAPEVHADLQAEHARTDGLQREVLELAQRLEGAGEAERISLGRRIHDRLCGLTAEHLRHTEREEIQGQRALWAHCTDEELLALHRRILAAVSPADMAEWVALMLPNMSLRERAELLRPMAANVPAPVLLDLLAPARAALGERWAATAAAVGL